MKLVTPLKNAKNIGSAKSGFAHWWSLRISSVALIFLTGWALYSAYVLVPLDYYVFIGFLMQPLNALLATLLIVACFYHGYLGIEEVIIDYIHCECAKITLLVGLKLLSVFAAAASVFAIFTIYFFG